MLLFIDACVRDASRTRRLANYLLDRLGAPVTELRLNEQTFTATDQAFLDQDTIVIAAPFWDLSFPAALKQYFERVNAVGVTFSYSPEGIPMGLCRAKRLWYVTTAGGPILSAEYGYGYVRALAEGFYQIPETTLIKAEGLDIQGADVEVILQQAKRDIDRML